MLFYGKLDLHPEPWCHCTEIMYGKEIDNEYITLC